MFAHALVLGKFYPPHAGHHHLIRTAVARPATRAGLCARAVVVGAESTGTTTLSRAPAGHYRTAWVAEEGRRHTEDKLTAVGICDELLARHFRFSDPLTP